MAHPAAGKIDKKHIATVVLFAIKYIPNTDAATLHKFLELVNTTGSFGWISEQQLLAEMRLMVKYVPGTCQESLLRMLELLEACVPLDNNNSRKALMAPADQPTIVDLPRPSVLEIFTQT